MLAVNEIFESISGEAGGIPQGAWTTFVRVQGCNLRCSWCDTKQAQSIVADRKTKTKVEEVLKNITERGNRQVLITGGEPLLQRGTQKLLNELLAKRYTVQVETNGTQKLPAYGTNYSLYWIIDYKCPSSGMLEEMPSIVDLRRAINRHRQGRVYVKWVIGSSLVDIDFAIDMIAELVSSHGRLIPAFQPYIISPLNAGGDKIREITRKIKEKDKELLNYIIFSVQLHKISKMP